MYAGRDHAPCVDSFTLDRLRLARFLFWSIFWFLILLAAPSAWAANIDRAKVLIDGSVPGAPAASDAAVTVRNNNGWTAAYCTLVGQPSLNGVTGQPAGWTSESSWRCRGPLAGADNSMCSTFGGDWCYYSAFRYSAQPSCPSGFVWEGGYSGVTGGGQCVEDTGPPTDEECQTIYGASPESPVEIAWNQAGFATPELAAQYTANCGSQDIEPFGADLGCITRVVDDRCACGISADAGAGGYIASCVGYASSYTAGDPPIEAEATAEEEYAPVEVPLETTVTEDEIELCIQTATSTIEASADGGVVNLCTVTTVTDTGASCSSAGDTSTTRRCQSLYADGSTATTTTRTGTVGGVTTVNTGSTTTTGPGTGLYPGVEEGSDGAYGFRSCQQPPVCEGDTLQCGEIELAWLQACQGYLVAEAYEGELGTMNSDILAEIEAGETTFDLEAAPFLDEVGSLEGSRICPAPLSFTALGNTFSFPLDTLCDYAGYLSLLILGFASFRAVKIALGGVQAAVT